jgi:hypothetical protein
MKASDIKAGRCYRARVSGKVTTVRVDSIEETVGYRRGGWTVGDTYRRTRFLATNLATGRQVVFLSARKFLGEASQ